MDVKAKCSRSRFVNPWRFWRPACGHAVPVKDQGFKLRHFLQVQQPGVRDSRQLNMQMSKFRKVLDMNEAATRDGRSVNIQTREARQALEMNQVLVGYGRVVQRQGPQMLQALQVFEARFCELLVALDTYPHQSEARLRQIPLGIFHCQGKSSTCTAPPILSTHSATRRSRSLSASAGLITRSLIVTAGTVASTTAGATVICTVVSCCSWLLGLGVNEARLPAARGDHQGMPSPTATSGRSDRRFTVGAAT